MEVKKQTTNRWSSLQSRNVASLASVVPHTYMYIHAVPGLKYALSAPLEREEGEGRLHRSSWKVFVDMGGRY